MGNVFDERAIGSVAIAGVVGIATELASAGVLDKAAIERLRAFMSASATQSGASPVLREHLLQALEHQFDGISARQGWTDTESQGPAN